jgi:branched-chain amino acid transport system substrate-binding protein
MRLRTSALGLGLSMLAAWAAPAAAQTPGVTATEIKIGSTQPLSGPASAYGVVAASTEAYFTRLNEAGGIHGRKITWLPMDDAFTPAKTVEQTRKLVEQEGVFMIFAPQGTAASSSVTKYLNAKKVPQFFVNSGSHLFQNPKDLPWTVPYLPTYYGESRIYAKHILANKPDAKVGVLYQNDDFGRDYLRGIKAGLGDKAAKMVISEQGYEVTDPTVDSQIVALKSAGVDVLLLGSLSKQSSQAIRKIADLNWKPTIYMSYISANVSPTFTNAGLDKATGIITATAIKDPTDTRWAGDKDYQDWLAWMKKYYPKGDLANMSNVFAYIAANTLEHALRETGKDLTREGLLKTLSTLDYAAPMLTPGVKLSFSPNDYNPYKKLQMQRFDGTKWTLLGEPIGD